MISKFFKFTIKLVFSLVVLLAIFFLVGYYTFIGFSESNSGQFFNKKENAIWLRHAWVEEKFPEEEIVELVNNLKSKNIKHVYVHSGPFENDGTIKPQKYIEAKRFLEIAKQTDPEMIFYAWLGQIRGKISLDSLNVRNNMQEVMKDLTEDVGFKGIHIDIEPIEDDDISFLNLLDTLNQELHEDIRISVALEEMIPHYIGIFMPLFFDIKSYNSTEFYKEVASKTDQIAIMTYDTKVNSPWLYRELVRMETIFVTKSIDQAEILIGIPVYEDIRSSFNPEAENVFTGLNGVISGLNSTRSNPDNFTGVALYANWEMDDSEWQIYDTYWNN